MIGIIIFLFGTFLPVAYGAYSTYTAYGTYMAHGTYTANNNYTAYGIFIYTANVSYCRYFFGKVVTFIFLNVCISNYNITNYGITELRHYGITTLRHYGIAALRHYGITALRHCG